MKRIDQSEFVHCCQHTLALPRRTKSADKSDALQTLRALLRHPTGAKRLECVGLESRFPDGAWDSLARQVNRGLSLVIRMHWDLEQVRRRPLPRGPITQPRARMRMTTRTTGHSAEWTWRRAFLGVALAVASLPLAVSKIRATEVGTSERQIPPPGIRISAKTRKELETGAELLSHEIDSLRVVLNEKPDKFALLPDVEIFHKAVDWALRYDEFYQSNEVQIARALLSQGRERAAQLRNGDAPWTNATGLIVRGYLSRLDGSVQPYGLVVPASWVRQTESLTKDSQGSNYRLDVWLH